MRVPSWTAAALTTVLLGTTAFAEAPSWVPTFGPDGTVHVPAFDLPPSDFASAEAREAQMARSKMRPRGASPGMPDIATRRAGAEAFFAPQVEEMKRRYPAEIAEQVIGNVRVRVVTPRGVALDKNRVLINVHGGGFNSCAGACGAMESLPIAGLGGFKVITVDYRQAPEFVFPAASEDIAAVYRELLKTYKPKQIGIYGCSAGGSLSAQTAAWLPAHGLPQIGAIGVFGAGGVPFLRGDSAYIAARVDGNHEPPPAPGVMPPSGGIRSYFEGTDLESDLVSPALHPTIAAKFPPTLLITGTRAMDLSPAVVTHSKLLDAGVDSQLIVGEGMGHCYIYDPRLPEAQSAYRQIVRFFQQTLG